MSCESVAREALAEFLGAAEEDSAAERCESLAPWDDALCDEVEASFLAHRCCGDALGDSDSEPDDLSTRGSASGQFSACSWCSSCSRESRDAPPATSPRPRRPTRWELAVALAARTALACSAAARGDDRPERAPRRKCRSAGGDRGPLQPASFESMREEFLRKNNAAIRSSLGRCFEGRVSLRSTALGLYARRGRPWATFSQRPAPMAACVQQRFMQGCRDCKLDSSKPQARLRAAFHGTDAGNHESIFAKGLLIPGSSGVSVRNANSHGRGVYTSSVEHAWLSRDFCTAPSMLVCGVLDDAVALKSAYVLGRHLVTAESSAIRHVGNAVVVFDTSRVVPLFEATGESLRQQPGRPSMARPPPAVAQRQGVGLLAPQTVSQAAGEDVLLRWRLRLEALSLPRRSRVARPPAPAVAASKVVAFLSRRAATRRRDSGM